jgi:hypothetical protein
MAQRQKPIAFKAAPELEQDIEKACGGLCSKSKLIKEAVLKELARRKALSLGAANASIQSDGYRTLNYVQISDEDNKTGIVTKYDDTGSFITHILVPFSEGGRKFYRDQNGYKWVSPEDVPEGEEVDREGDFYPIFTEDGEVKEID